MPGMTECIIILISQIVYENYKGDFLLGNIVSLLKKIIALFIARRLYQIAGALVVVIVLGVFFMTGNKDKPDYNNLSFIRQIR